MTIFECKKCGKKYNFDALVYSAFIYGLILLTGKTDYYYGFNCVFCKNPTTNLFKHSNRYSQKFWERFAKSVEEIGPECTEITWAYDSFPYNSPDFSILSLPEPIYRGGGKISYDLSWVLRCELDNCVNDAKRRAIMTHL